MNTGVEPEPSEPAKVKQESGGRRRFKKGNHHISIGVPAEIFALLGEAAAASGLPKTKFVIAHAVTAARRILKEGA